MNRILLIIFLIFGSGFAGEFYKLSELGDFESKQDSVIWVENPIPDVRMGPNETKSIDISNVFSISPDTTLITFDFPVSGNDSMVTANLTQNSVYDPIYLNLISKTVYGSTYVIVKAESIFGTAEDTLIVKVDNPAYEWLEWGSAYSFLPENCVGNGTSEWKAAQNFDLGTSEYEIMEIEFGYAWDGVADWKIAEFSDVPCDSSIWTPDSTFYSTNFKGGEAEYIEIPADSSLKMTGNIAVVFTTTANFMPMDPIGDSDHTWIYSESSGWEHPEEISADYAGAWYIRLLVFNTMTGIEEVITTEKNPVIMRNYPNPFNNQTVISWDLPNSGQVELDIYNSNGQFVKNLVNESRNKGRHSVVFDAGGMETGIYFYQLKINGKIENTNKMLYLK